MCEGYLRHATLGLLALTAATVMPAIAHASCEHSGVFKLDELRHYAQELREKIRTAALDDAENSTREGAKSVPFRGTEYQFIDPLKAMNGHVVSLASGPDMYRAMVDFPLARHIHLVDTLQGWGKGPLDLIREISWRLKNLAPGAKVEILEPGLAGELKGNQLKDPTILESLFQQRPGLRIQSRTWRVTWSDSVLGPQERFIHLHPLNYENAEQMEFLFGIIYRKGGLGGLLLCDALPPPFLSKLLKRLSRGGIFVAETFTDEKSGERRWPQFDEELKKMEQEGFTRMRARSYDFPVYLTGVPQQPNTPMNFYRVSPYKPEAWILEKP